MSINNVKDDILISEEVAKFLQEKQVFADVSVVSGSKNRPSRTKLILVNTLFAMHDEEDSEISGSINVNIQDSDAFWIEYISEVLNLLLDETIVGGYKLEFTTEHLFKISNDLFFKNLKFKFTSL